jgi:hypothetical protein
LVRLEGILAAFELSTQAANPASLHRRHTRLSHTSFAFASATVCHCIFETASGSLHFSGSFRYPRRAPLVFPVDGAGVLALEFGRDGAEAVLGSGDGVGHGGGAAKQPDNRQR